MRGKASCIMPTVWPIGNNPAHAGKTLRDPVVLTWPRNNPAHAGKRGASSGFSTCWTEQPRVRGEKELTSDDDVRQWGTTPHTRGIALRGAWVRKCRGEQPRIRGEYVLVRRCGRLCWGTTPRTQGIHIVTRTLKKPPGNNPAYVGKVIGCGQPVARRRYNPACAGKDFTTCRFRAALSSFQSTCLSPRKLGRSQ